MVDRAARQELMDHINAFLDEQITAFEFNELLHSFRGPDIEPTVRAVAELLWYHYDDCKDHLVAFSKPQWDHVQRLMLILASDAELHSASRRIWSVRQLFAAIQLAGCAWLAARFGVGQHLLVMWMPLGLASNALSKWRTRSLATREQTPCRLVPFSSISELKQLRRSVPGFRKRQIPAAVAQREVRSPLMMWLIMCQFYLMWIVFAPLTLFGQCLPYSEDSTVIVQSPSAGDPPHGLLTR